MIANWLFTDPEQLKEPVVRPPGYKEPSSDDDEQEEEGEQTPVAKPAVAVDEKTLAAKEKDLHHKKFMNFPCNSGLSGHVF